MKKGTKIAIIGIGRVGLPLSLAFARVGFKVYGIDVNTDMIEGLKNKKMPFMEVNGSMLLSKFVNKSFIPTDNYAVIKDVDYIILALGTAVDENLRPVYREIDSALSQSANYLHPGQTLILRSTVSPETTDYIKEFINKIPKLTVGKNFYVAFCPERIAEGKALKELFEIPQIIGADDEETANRCVWLFSKFGVKCLVTDTTSAELAKVFTNMYRYINFAIANEFMMISQNYGRDIFKIVDLVNRDYKRGGLASPGLAAGPCLYKDGFFITDSLPFVDLMHISWKVNESTPSYLIDELKKFTSLYRKKVVILGLAFKPEIDDARESLALTAKNSFSRAGSKVFIHDPYIKPYDTDVYLALQDADIVFVATKHKPYQELDFKKIKRLVTKNCLICDIWNLFQTDKLIFPAKKI